MHFTPFKGNTSKSQFYFLQILEIGLFLATKQLKLTVNFSCVKTSQVSRQRSTSMKVKSRRRWRRRSGAEGWLSSTLWRWAVNRVFFYIRLSWPHTFCGDILNFKGGKKERKLKVHVQICPKTVFLFCSNRPPAPSQKTFYCYRRQWSSMFHANNRFIRCGNICFKSELFIFVCLYWSLELGVELQTFIQACLFFITVIIILYFFVTVYYH